MNILFLSSSDSGGAGKAAYQIFSTLNKIHNCKFVVFRKDGIAKDVHQVNNVNRTGYFLYRIYNKFMNRISFLLKWKPFDKYDIDLKYDMLNLMEPAPYLKLNNLYSIIDLKPDLIILNWISGFINSKDIKRLHRKYKTPFIWFLHDYAPMTGGCHIAWDCNGYKRSCGSCPGLRSTIKHDITRRILNSKIKNIKHIPIYTTGWSDFIISKSKQSSLFKDHTLSPVSPAIDHILFCPPYDKGLCKEKLGIPKLDKIILFGAQNIFSEYKGFKDLLAALDIIDKYLHQGITFHLVTFGKSENQTIIPTNYNWLKLKEIDSGNLSLAYQAADVFVAPTLQDTGPMTVCESLMCGTPVVGYPMGIIPMIVQNGISGFIVNEGQIEILAERIAHILDMEEEEYNVLSSNCRQIALEKCTEEAQLNSFENLFRKINYSRQN